MKPRTPRSTLFPYTTLFRSGTGEDAIRPALGVRRRLDAGRGRASVRWRRYRVVGGARPAHSPRRQVAGGGGRATGRGDRKSTRLNSSHVEISYAVFCLKKKK